MGPHERARALILEHGRNATSYQILNPGFLLWFNRDHTAVVGYVEHHGVRVVAGIPICADAILADVVVDFERQAARDGFDVAYFCVERYAVRLWGDDATRAALVVGAQPVWQPASLVRAMRTHSSLRAQLNRAANKGVRVEQWDAARAESSQKLRSCLNQWLDRRGMPPLRFLVEPDTLPVLMDRRAFVALRGDEVVGFLIAAPITQRKGWLIEQNVRGDAAPNGTIEALLFAAAEWMCDNGDALVTLGLSPLSIHAPQSEIAPPRSVRALFAWLRIHGRRFYNFEGLDKFKAKFRPDAWEPVYAVVNRRERTWKGLIAIGAAFGGTSVIPFAAKVVRHAVAQELSRVRRRMK
jgi:phosphatidylglycerol lysyltransferase